MTEYQGWLVLAMLAVITSNTEKDKVTKFIYGLSGLFYGLTAILSIILQTL